MSSKPVVALFASNLHAFNPRGTGRLFRALAEQLARYDEFDSIVLQDAMRMPAGSAFTYMTLPDWLKAHQLIITGDKRPRPLFRRRTWRSYATPRISNHVSWVKNLHPVEMLHKTLHPELAGRLMWVLRQVRRRLSLRHWVSPPPDPGQPSHPPGPAQVISLEDLDLLLTFSWFNSAEHPLLRWPRPAHVRSVTWFLDAIPQRVGHFDERAHFRDHHKCHVHVNNVMADHVVAISESARRDLVRFFHVPEERTSVVPCGTSYGTDEPPKAPLPHMQRVFERYGLDPGLPIVLCVGMNDPWKNTLNVLRACLLLSSQPDAKPARAFQLVFVGEMTMRHNVVQYAHLSRRLAERMPVVFAGYVADDELDFLLRASSVFLFPSLWEGFGIPPLDAMGCGVPVVTSDTGPMPEVCGPHALYCDPFDPESIAQALTAALGLKGAALAEYQTAAREHAKKMSWSAAGEALAAMVRRQLEAGREAAGRAEGEALHDPSQSGRPQLRIA
ncbi:MAG: glycosyltransferase family 4 protein [Planctomycetaceae bacterium]